MESRIRLRKFHALFPMSVLFAIILLFFSCKKEPAATGKLPGHVIPYDLYDSLQAEPREKIDFLITTTKEGAEPSFENVGGIFPKMKYPQAIVGVKEHTGRFYVSWDGRIVSPPLHVFFKVGKDTVLFGKEEEKISRSLLDGYLPVITTNYQHDGITFGETVYGYSLNFSTANPLMAFIRMKIGNPSGEKKETKLSVCFMKVENQGRNNLPSKDVPFSGELSVKGNNILNKEGKTIFFSKQAGGKFERDRLVYDLSLNAGEEKELFFCFPQVPVSAKDDGSTGALSFTEGLEKVRIFWKEVVERGMEVDVPEEIVRNAYKTWLINDFLLSEEDTSRGYYEVHDAPYFILPYTDLPQPCT